MSKKAVTEGMLSLGAGWEGFPVAVAVSWVLKSAEELARRAEQEKYWGKLGMGREVVLCEKLEAAWMFAFQGLNSQANKPPEEPMSVLRRWLADNVRVLLEQLEHEVLELEQLVRDLEGWLDALLGEPQPKLPCSTLRDYV